MGKTNNSPAWALPSTRLPTDLRDTAPVLWQEPQQALQICHTQEHVLWALETGACKSPASHSLHLLLSFSEKEEQGTEMEASNASCDH